MSLTSSTTNELLIADTGPLLALARINGCNLAGKNLFATESIHKGTVIR
jgi:hypothetical protein